MTSPESRVGDVLASKYRLEALLGSGGMGHVYKAVNELVGRPVAIKLLKEEHAQNAQVVERFLREARAANLVRHPHVVDVIDIGKDESGNPFIVQELLDGEDLSKLAARVGGKIETEPLLDMLMPVIEAVAHAHAQNVVHRDIKPENVFLAKGPHGRIAKLLDFGISKIRAPDLRATEVGVMMGTPAYMAPEQIQGARDADPRSDVWALGVMLFELLAGRLPFDGVDAPALFVAVATKDAPSLLDVGAPVHPDISRVVARCLRRRPDERYPSAAELFRDLNHIIDGADLEPTGRRSIPPALGALVPDLAIPQAKSVEPALARTVAMGKKEPPQAPEAIEAPAIEAPSLSPPPTRPSVRKEPAPEAPDFMDHSAPDLMDHAASPTDEGRSRLATEASLPGVMLAPGASHATRKATRGDWGVKPREARADMSFLVALGVIGLVVILGIGVLMQLAHTSEGWPVARFVNDAPSPQRAMAIHGGLALVGVAFGITSTRRAYLHWRGELGGGIAGAFMNGIFAAGAFFAVIELLTAIS
ncbi:MAG: protein kinase [Labilithrix sp.]|nr:protein kinase [Labilithrix sp.]